MTQVRYASGQEVPRGVPRTEGVGWWHTGAAGVGASNLLIGTWDERRELAGAYRKEMRRQGPRRLELGAE